MLELAILVAHGYHFGLNSGFSWFLVSSKLSILVKHSKDLYVKLTVVVLVEKGGGGSYTKPICAYVICN